MLVGYDLGAVLPDGYDNDEHFQLFKQKKDEENGKEDDPNFCKSGTHVNLIAFFFLKYCE